MFHGYKLGQKITDDNDDLYRGQLSTEVKFGNLCNTATIPHLVRCWLPLIVIKVKDDQRSDRYNTTMACKHWGQSCPF